MVLVLRIGSICCGWSGFHALAIVKKTKYRGNSSAEAFGVLHWVVALAEDCVISPEGVIKKKQFGWRLVICCSRRCPNCLWGM